MVCVSCFPKSPQRVLGGGLSWAAGPVEVINEPENAPSKLRFDWTLPLFSQNNLIQPPPPIRQAMAVRPYGEKTARPLLNRHQSRPLPASPSASHQLISIKYTRISVPACVPLLNICCSPLSPLISPLFSRLLRKKTS